MTRRNPTNTTVMDEMLSSFRARCRQSGLRVTPQRTAIFQYLIRTTNHPTATEIYQEVRTQYPNISLGTVNSSLVIFEEKGIIYSIGATGDPRRFEGNLAPHYHLRCTRCRRIIDLDSGISADINVPAEIQARYRITGTKVLLEGVCDKCRLAPSISSHKAAKLIAK